MNLTSEEWGKDLEELWSRFDFGPETQVRLGGDKHSPVMRPFQVLITTTGIELKCVWAHEGQIRTEWIPIHLLEEAPLG